MVLKYLKVWRVNYAWKTDEMIINAPPGPSVQHCCFAFLNQNSPEETRLGKIRASKKEAKIECALALLKYLDSRPSWLPSFYAMEPTNYNNTSHFHVFMYICSVEFSLRRKFLNIYNSLSNLFYLEIISQTVYVKNWRTMRETLFKKTANYE